MRKTAKYGIGTWLSLTAVVLVLLAGCGSDPTKETNRLTTEYLKTMDAEMLKGDMDRLLSIWAEDAVQTTPNGAQHGTTELRQYFEGLRTRYSSMKLNEVSRLVLGRQAALRVERMLTTIDGKALDVPVAIFLEFNDQGKIKSNRIYYDTAAMERKPE